MRVQDTQATKPPLDGVETMLDPRGRSLRAKIVRGVIVLLATLGGAVAGFAVTLAIVVAKARAGAYIFALHDLAAVRWETLPIPIFALAGFFSGLRRPMALDRAILWGVGAMLAGAIVGALLGGVVWGTGEGQWAGGIILAAAGLVLGGVMMIPRRHHPSPRLFAGAIGAMLILSVGAFTTMGVTNFIEIEPLALPEFEGIPVPDPENVDAVVFLVGDAGATEAGRTPLLTALNADVERWSDSLGRDSAVSVVYLGDLVYPVGVRDRDHPAFPTDSARLWNQIDLVRGEQARQHATVGLFLTGNHDWGNTSGDAGIDRVRNLEAQLALGRAAGAYVSLLPPAGEPGPVVRDLRRNVRIIFIDTHWFLQARSAQERDAFFERLADALDSSGDREVIVVAHHPYYSAGPHGAIIPGDHAGGIAYLLQKSGTLVQDLNSPVYAELLGRMREVFRASMKPPLVFAGGHDHSLQVLTGEGDFDPRFVLVSGSGSKLTSIRNSPGLVWGASQPGYMMLVFRRDDAVDLFAVGGDPAYRHCAGRDAELRECMTTGANSFDVVYSASLLGPAKLPVRVAVDAVDTTRGTPWWTEVEPVPTDEMDDDVDSVLPAPVAVPARELVLATDTVSTTPGRTYSVGPFAEAFFGKLNRHLWRIPLRLPVLDLDSAGGGLAPDELVGGKQTIGLRFNARDGLDYEFRSIVKDPSRVLPEWLRDGIISDFLDDQMAAQFPLGAVVAGELLEAAGIAAPKPVPVVMPNDPRLGEYRAMFAGRVGLFSTRAKERKGGRPGFGGFSEIVDSDEAAAAIRAEPGSRYDARYFLRIRLIDMLMGDWDRHAGQWSWGRIEENGVTVWRPIPEDRDWAFARIDGFARVLSRIFMPRYVGFSDRLPHAERLARSAAPLDRRVLSELTRKDFLEAAAFVAGALTDSVIDAAVAKLPGPYLEVERDRLTTSLRSRREGLHRLAEQYYAFVAGSIHVYGAEGVSDVIVFEPVGDDRVRIRRTVGADGAVVFERIVVGGETDDVVLFIDEAEDRVIGTDARLPFDVLIRSQDGED